MNKRNLSALAAAALATSGCDNGFTGTEITNSEPWEESCAGVLLEETGIIEDSNIRFGIDNVAYAASFASEGQAQELMGDQILNESVGNAQSLRNLIHCATREALNKALTNRLPEDGGNEPQSLALPLNFGDNGTITVYPAREEETGALSAPYNGGFQTLEEFDSAITEETPLTLNLSSEFLGFGWNQPYYITAITPASSDDTAVQAFPDESMIDEGRDATYYDEDFDCESSDHVTNIDLCSELVNRPWSNTTVTIFDTLPSEGGEPYVLPSE